jgi:TonB family protein
MLKNNRYSKWALAKIGFVAPFIVFLLMLNCKNKSEETLIPSTETEIPFDEYFSEGDTVYVTITEGELKGQEFILTKEEKPLRFVEEMPEPIGGFDVMYTFMNENIKYPAEAREQEIQGQVFLEFVVERDGSITDVKVIKGAHPLLDEEALRVVKLLPAWKPGKQNGEPVRCYYNIPIRFIIDKEKEKE